MIRDLINNAPSHVKFGPLHILVFVILMHHWWQSVQCKQTHDMNIIELYRAARCEALCIQQGCTAFEDKILNNATNCMTSCKNLTDCEAICICLYTSKHDVPKSSEMLAVLPPRMACQDLKSTNKYLLVTIVIQLELRKEEEAALAKSSVPVIYVIERRERTSHHSKPESSIGVWIPLAKTRANVVHIPNLQPSWQYQFRVTAVAPDGILGSNSSDWLQTLSANNSLPPPKKLYVESVSAKGSHLSAMLKWEPPDEKMCYYDLFLYYDEGKTIRNKFIVLYEDGLQVELNNLAFNVNYTLHIETVSLDREASSQNILNWTKTPPCLKVFGHNFTLCGPGPPNSIHADIYSANPDFWSVIVTWLPPNFTTEVNSILNYRVTLQSIMTFPMMTLIRPFFQHIAVNGNITEAEFHNISKGLNYSLEVRGTSIGGHGATARTYFFVPDPYTSKEIDKESSHSSLFIFVGIPCLLFGVLVIAGIIAFKVSRQRFVRAIQSRYFKSFEEIKLQGEIEVNVAQTNSDIFEVDFSSLLLGEVLGQGAFGVVRKAQMRSNKQWEMWENVAVKMMRPGYHDCNQNQLLEEIEMIRSVGKHPNIVSVLAYCTKPPNVCLVVEYCEFGDLQSYLRKMRNEKFQNAVYNLKYSSEQKNISSFTNGTDYPHIITYKTIKHSPCHSGTGPVLKLVTQMMQIKEGFDDNEISLKAASSSSNIATDNSDHYTAKHLIPNDLLSFARQIAMGMEYLSNNKFVHRDLAARNVLVHTPRVVKISDFGLMKDIYENSFYIRKTEGKLPIKWMAYESIFDHIFTTKSDVWSFGILLWEIVTLGGAPYPGISCMQLINLLKQGYRMEKPSNCSSELYEIMMHCWRTNTIQRPTFNELRHKFESMLESTLDYVSLDVDPDIIYEQTDDSSRI